MSSQGTIRERWKPFLAEIRNGTRFQPTYPRELNALCGSIVLFVALLSAVAGLAFIPSDLKLSGQPLIVGLRIGYSAVGVAVLVLHLTGRFRRQSLLLVTIIAGYLIFSSALVTVLARGDAAYFGGYVFVLTLLSAVPIRRAAAWAILGASVAAFLILGLLDGVRFDSAQGQYGLSNLLSAIVVNGGLIYLMDRTRCTSWQRSRRIQQQQEELSADKHGSISSWARCRRRSRSTDSCSTLRPSASSA